MTTNGHPVRPVVGPAPKRKRPAPTRYLAHHIVQGREAVWEFTPSPGLTEEQTAREVLPESVSEIWVTEVEGERTK